MFHRCGWFRRPGQLHIEKQAMSAIHCALKQLTVPVVSGRLHRVNTKKTRLQLPSGAIRDTAQQDQRNIRDS